MFRKINNSSLLKEKKLKLRESKSQLAAWLH